MNTGRAFPCSFHSEHQTFHHELSQLSSNSPKILSHSILQTLSLRQWLSRSLQWCCCPPNGGVYSLQTLRHAVSFSASPGGMSRSAAPTRRCWPRLSLAPDITADGGAFFRGARALDSLRNLFGRTTVTAVAKRMRVLGAWRRTCSETVNKAGFVVVSWARRRGRDVFF